MDLVMKCLPLGAQESTRRNLAPMLTCGKTIVGYQSVTMSFSYRAEVGGSRPSAPTGQAASQDPARRPEQSPAGRGKGAKFLELPLARGSRPERVHERCSIQQS